MRYDDCETIKNVPQSIQICNFGSSHGANGFNYEDAAKKYTCVNFALHSQSLLYDYRILQNYKGHLAPESTVFIVISYFSFFGRPEVESNTFLSKNKRYYKFLPPELILQYDWKTDIYVNYLPALSSGGLVNCVKLLLGLDMADSEVDNPKPYGRRISKTEQWERQTNPTKAETDAIEAYKRHFGGQFDETGRRIRKQEAFNAIYSIINLCRQIGAKPVMLTVPYTREYTNIIRKNDPEFFSDFYAVIEEVRHNAGIEYYDYAFDERFCGEHGLFNSCDHLNREGARRFTNTILREVLGIEY